VRLEVFMRAEKLAAALVVFSLLGGGALAQQAELPTKIAFVYVQKVLTSTEEGKIRVKQLDEWARPRQEDLARLDKEISDLKGQIQARQGSGPDDVLIDLNKKLVAKQREFEDKQRIAKREADEKQQALLKELGGKMQEVLNQYADANRFTVIFVLNPNEVAYLAKSADITDTIITLYNEKYPVASQPAAATPTK
jgi:Skp family chaperone for outer membrane proteins